MNPKSQLDQHNLLPKKSLGQNFLQDPNTLEKIAASADLMPEDAVLEIGPGTGALTAALAGLVRRVVAVELDGRMEPILRQRFANNPNVEFVFNDILETDVTALMGPGPYVVVANVPYYITSAILRHLLEAQNRPQRIVMTVQLEVAERLAAKPNDMSLLAVSTQFYGKPRIVQRLSSSVFWPRPDVDSAVVRLDLYETPPVDVPDEATFFKIVRAGFSQKRKQIKNALADALALPMPQTVAFLEAAGIDPRRRAETLTLDEWGALTRAYAAR
jgi:16S rRNA (adenine1518-N6/adenine1519-N6)-dimethyltransferase